VADSGVRLTWRDAVPIIAVIVAFVALNARDVRNEGAPYARVYTRYKTTVSGYLIHRGREGLLLKNATVLFEGQMGGETPVTGDVVIPRESLDFDTLT
jgi:hypothetical protein